MKIFFQKSQLYTIEYIIEELGIIEEKVIKGYTDEDHVEDLKASIALIKNLIDLFERQSSDVNSIQIT